jgi:RNA polymerase sigma-70 factor (ECF subfamily)
VRETGREALPPEGDRPDADALLVSRAAAGEEGAFETLVARHRDRVYRLALRFFARPEDAEEVAQDVFLRAYRSLASFQSRAPFGHWLLRIATNACRDRLRARRSRPEATAPAPAGDPDGWLDAALGGRAIDAARREAARRLASDLLDRLRPKDRIVLVLMDLEGLSAAEVAAATGSTRAAVKVRAMRARRALRRLAGGTSRRMGR